MLEGDEVEDFLERHDAAIGFHYIVKYSHGFGYGVYPDFKPFKSLEDAVQACREHKILDVAPFVRISRVPVEMDISTREKKLNYIRNCSGWRLKPDYTVVRSEDDNGTLACAPRVESADNAKDYAMGMINARSGIVHTDIDEVGVTWVNGGWFNGDVMYKTIEHLGRRRGHAWTDKVIAALNRGEEEGEIEGIGWWFEPEDSVVESIVSALLETDDIPDPKSYAMKHVKLPDLGTRGWIHCDGSETPVQKCQPGGNAWNPVGGWVLSDANYDMADKGNRVYNRWCREVLQALDRNEDAGVAAGYKWKYVRDRKREALDARWAEQERTGKYDPVDIPGLPESIDPDEAKDIVDQLFKDGEYLGVYVTKDEDTSFITDRMGEVEDPTRLSQADRDAIERLSPFVIPEVTWIAKRQGVYGIFAERPYHNLERPDAQLGSNREAAIADWTRSHGRVPANAEEASRMLVETARRFQARSSTSTSVTTACSALTFGCPTRLSRPSRRSAKKCKTPASFPAGACPSLRDRRLRQGGDLVHQLVVVRAELLRKLARLVEEVLSLGAIRRAALQGHLHQVGVKGVATRECHEQVEQHQVLQRGLLLRAEPGLFVGGTRLTGPRGTRRRSAARALEATRTPEPASGRRCCGRCLVVFVHGLTCDQLLRVHCCCIYRAQEV